MKRRPPERATRRSETHRERSERPKKQDKTLVLEALRAVLADPDATAAQRLYAVAVLDRMCYYNFVPYGVKYPGEDESTAAFAAELEAHNGAEKADS